MPLSTFSKEPVTADAVQHRIRAQERAAAYRMAEGVLLFCLLSWTLLQWVHGARLKVVLLALTQKDATLPSQEDIAILQARTTTHAKVWGIGFCLAVGTLVCLAIYAGGVLAEASSLTLESVAGLRPALSALVLWLVFGFVLSDELRFKEKASWVPAKSRLGERAGGALVMLARAVEEAAEQAQRKADRENIPTAPVAETTPATGTLPQKDFRP